MQNDRQLTDLWSWVNNYTGFVFTVGQYKAPVYAMPSSNPPIVSAILSNSNHITTFSGLPFIRYHVGGDYYIRFEIPDFRNPPEVFTVDLHFEKGGTKEDEPLKITIINTPPVIVCPLASEITIYDGQTETINYHATDPENSNLLDTRFVGTQPPPWITMTPGGLF